MSLSTDVEIKIRITGLLSDEVLDEMLNVEKLLSGLMYHADIVSYELQLYGCRGRRRDSRPKISSVIFGDEEKIEKVLQTANGTLLRFGIDLKKEADLVNV